MMAGKARLFGDDDVLQRIRAATDPKRAKTNDREVRGFDDKVRKLRPGRSFELYEGRKLVATGLLLVSRPC